jgi:hypothetical protein
MGTSMTTTKGSKTSCEYAANFPCVLLCFFLLMPADATFGQADIGTRYRGYPNSNCSDFEGFVVHATVDLTVSSAKCATTYEAWLSKEVKLEKDKTMIVLDHLRIPELRPGETFSSGPYCYRHGKEINWLAIYDWKKQKKLTHQSGGIRQAWIVNPTTERFEPVSQELLDDAVCLAGEDE